MAWSRVESHRPDSQDARRKTDAPGKTVFKNGPRQHSLPSKRAGNQ
jgi:hypothetical protein